MRFEVVRDAAALEALRGTWRDLWLRSARRPANLHPDWIAAWWRSYGGGSGNACELSLVLVREGVELVGVAPFCALPPHGGALRSRELRLLGGGVIVSCEAFLAAAGLEAAVSEAVVDALLAEPGWDLLDLSLAESALGEPGAAVDLGKTFAKRGRSVEREGIRGPWRADPSTPFQRWLDGRKLPPAILDGPARARATPCRRDEVGKSLALLDGLPQAAGEPLRAFLEAALPSLVDDGAASLWLLQRGDDPAGAPIAGEVVVCDGERRIEVLCAGAARDLAVDHLALSSLRQGILAGARRFEFAGRESFLATGRARGTRLRVFNTAATDEKDAPAAGLLRRGQSRLHTLRASVADAARRPIDRIARLGQATPEVVTQAIARVANLSRLHLYRGELFVRKTASPSTLRLSLLTLDDYLALPDRDAFRARLDLGDAYCRKKWERGDLVVLARDGDAPAGILWCARGPVYVPDIGREVLPLAGECYIHDVYVAPDARGRAVAPAMLAFLAAELRRRDLYRAWALIERQNTASTRAFEKAAYASVADVIFARMGIASKLLVRPPDPEAKAFLGMV